MYNISGNGWGGGRGLTQVHIPRKILNRILSLKRRMDLFFVFYIFYNFLGFT
jgi:hypothetical protein